MTRYRLKQILERDSIDPAAYELTGGHPSEVYVLDDRDPHWAVYYSASIHRWGRRGEVIGRVGT